MKIVFFASGGPGNFRAALELAAAYPKHLSVDLLVTDRLGTASGTLARLRGVKVFEFDYMQAERLRPLNEDSVDTRERFHDAILEAIKAFEEEAGFRFDLAVLAYRRIISGALLDYFSGRMINQHPADLSLLDPEGHRLYTGIKGLRLSLQDGHRRTRTSTILVDAGTDTGEIICRGPECLFDGDAAELSDRRAHEDLQKRVSDWPSLKFALAAIASGALTRSQTRPFELWLNGERVSKSGVELNTADGEHRFFAR